MENLKLTLEDVFLDYMNDFITVEAFAENYGITKTEAKAIIRMGKKYHNRLCRERWMKMNGVKKHSENKNRKGL